MEAAGAAAAAADAEVDSASVPSAAAAPIAVAGSTLPEPEPAPTAGGNAALPLAVVVLVPVPFSRLDEPADALPGAAAERAERVGVRGPEPSRGDDDVAAAAAATAADDEREAEATGATSPSFTSSRGLLVAPGDGASIPTFAGEGQSSLPAVDGGVAIDPPPPLSPPPLLLRPAPPRDILSLFLTVSPSTAGDGGTPSAAEEAAAEVAELAAVRTDARAFPVELARGSKEGAGVVAAPPREPAVPPALLGVVARRVTTLPPTAGTGEGFLATGVEVDLGDATGVAGRLPLPLPPPMLPLLRGGAVQPRGSGCKTNEQVDDAGARKPSSCSVSPGYRNDCWPA